MIYGVDLAVGASARRRRSRRHWRHWRRRPSCRPVPRRGCRRPAFRSASTCRSPRSWSGRSPGSALARRSARRRSAVVVGRSRFGRSLGSRIRCRRRCGARQSRRRRSRRSQRAGGVGAGAVGRRRRSAGARLIRARGRNPAAPPAAPWSSRTTSQRSPSFSAQSSCAKFTATFFSPMPRKPPTPTITDFDLAVRGDHDVVDVADILGVVAGAVIDVLADDVGGEMPSALTTMERPVAPSVIGAGSAGAGAGAVAPARRRRSRRASRWRW